MEDYEYRKFESRSLDKSLSIIHPEWYNDVRILTVLKERSDYWKIKRLYKIYTAFVSIYGQDRVDFTCTGLRTYSFDVIIHFPIVKISNTRNEHHVIYDLYFILSLELNAYGYRTTFSIEEWCKEYAHSHLSNTRKTNWCLGDSGTLNLFLTQLKGYNDRPIEVEQLEYLAFAIGAYVEHESIEGKPYRYMKDIKVVNSSATPYIEPNISEKLAYTIPFNYSIVHNWITINDDAVLDVLNTDEVSQEVFGKKLVEFSMQLSLPSITSTEVIFKGAYLIQKVIESEVKKYELPQYYRQLFINKLEKIINKHVYENVR